MATWRRGLSLSTRAAVLTAGTLLAAPLCLYYDLMLGAVAGAWLLRDRDWPAADWEKPVLALLYLVPLEGRHLAEIWQLPVFPLAAAALFALCLARAWREAAGMTSERAAAWRALVPNGARRR